MFMTLTRPVRMGSPRRAWAVPTWALVRQISPATIMLSPHHPGTSMERAWRQRRSGLLVGLTLAAMAITIIGVSLQMAQPASSPMGGMSMATANRTAPFDRQFIDMMVPHHQGAVAMARIALTRAQHPQIKRLAQSIVAAQQREIAEMKEWRKAWYGSAATPDMACMPMLPGLMMHMDMMADIGRLKTAKPFDKAFIDAMIPHHQMAIKAAELELAHGTHARLRSLALSIIEDQAREIGLMQAYRDLWYGGSAMDHMGGLSH